MNAENYLVLSDGLTAPASQADPSQDRTTRRATKNVMRPVRETQRKGAKSLFSYVLSTSFSQTKFIHQHWSIRSWRLSREKSILSSHPCTLPSHKHTRERLDRS